MAEEHPPAASAEKTNADSKEDESQASTSKKRPLPPSSVDPPRARVRKTLADKENTRRLIVVLENACLETYKVSSGPSSSSSGRKKKDGEEKWTLLNCDDHQHVLAKMGRQVATARPDITHQVRNPTTKELGEGDHLLSTFSSSLLVSLDFARLANQQSWPAASIHPHQQRSPHRSQPVCSDSSHIQAFQWFDGYVAILSLVLFFVSEPSLITVQLLQKLSIRSVNGSEKLLKVIKV
jgi:hypothetical protein